MAYKTRIMGLFDLDLQLFDGDGGGSGAGAGAADGAGMGQSVTEQEPALPASPRRKTRNQFAGAKFGRQPDAMPTQPHQQSALQETAPADPDAEWQDIRNNRYKAQFDADVQSIIRDRLKNRQDAEQQMATLAPALEALAKKHGKDVTDLSGIVAAITDDDSLYEDEAIERGLPVEVVKTMSKLQKDNEALQQRESQRQNEVFFQQHVQKLAMQAEELKKTVPTFDLRTEMQNPRFAAMTSPNGGVSVEDAYYALHHKEIQQGSMIYAAQQTQQKVAQSIQAGKNRPAENGVRTQPTAQVYDDPSKWTKEMRREVRRRVATGEKVFL